MGRIGCNIGEPDNDWPGGGGVGLPEVPGLTRSRLMAEHDSPRMLAYERWLRHKAAMAHIAIEPLRHPPVPKGVWR